jgi:glycosyltransferase involved in cell wall biosynthesis
LKVLLISNGFPPHHWAGTETYTAAIAQGLRKRNHQVQVLCGGDWEDGLDYYNGHSDDLYQDIPVRRLNLNWANAPDPFLYLYNNPVVADYLVNYLDELQPDLVHVTSCERLSASVLQTVKGADLPLILSLTDFWFLCPRINLLRSDGANCSGQTTAWQCLKCQLRHTKAYRWARRTLPEKSVAQLLTTISQYPQFTRQPGLRGMAGDMDDRKAFLHKALTWPDRRITASQFVHDMFVANGITVPIKVQPYGHDLAWLKSYTGKTSSDVIRIGFIGQINTHKGAHLLLHAANQLQDALGPRFSLSIYGDLEKAPGYSARLRDLAANIAHAQFCGTYAREQSADVYANLDVLVVPSLWYDFPLVICEAFATKTPIIATRLGGMAEAVTHEVSGLLFERGDVDDLTRQLQRIIEEPDLLERLQAGVPPVKTIEEEVSELEAIYHNLTAR